MLTRLQPIHLLLAAACGTAAGCTTGPPTAPPAEADTTAVPLADLGTRTYHGFEGGLYPGGSSVMPGAHAARGLEGASRIRPLDVQGNASASGRIVLLSVGMSNTSQEFCNPPPDDPLLCRGDEPFMPRARRDAEVDHHSLVIVNGARGSHPVDAWDQPADSVYGWVRDDVLAPQGLSESQVQVIWLKQANRGSTTRPSLPSEDADAYVLMEALGSTVRTLRIRYPNLQQVFLSSRTYGGYAANPRTNSPEPYAYETAFAVKWLIEAQIRQLESGMVDPRAGDLGPAVAPWIAWGPYLWANGMEPRSDGLVWRREDFHTDGIHLFPPGQGKVAIMLLNFFKAAPEARCWFLAGQTC
jgi:hypothetical protein